MANKSIASNGLDIPSCHTTRAHLAIERKIIRTVKNTKKYEKNETVVFAIISLPIE